MVGSRVLILVFSGVMLTGLALAPVAAQARTEQGHPELYENPSQQNATPVAPGRRVVGAFWGQIDFESPALGSEGIECVTLGFASGWNEGSPSRAFGQVLAWDAAGHVPEGTHTKLSASCRPETAGKPASFVTDEGFISSEENASHEVEASLRTLSVPWNEEVNCGVREEEDDRS